MEDKIIEKYYSDKDNCFHIMRRKCGSGFSVSEYDECFDDFDKFYRALNGDLSGANLLGYDFSNYDPKQYNLSNCKISSKTMAKLGKYNSKLYNSIKNVDSVVEETRVSYDLVQERMLQPQECHFSYKDENVAICYISDLHIPYKIMKNYNYSLNSDELDTYIRSKVISLRETIPHCSYLPKIIIVGDVSSSFSLFKKFFKIYRDEIFDEETFFVLAVYEENEL